MGSGLPSTFVEVHPGHGKLAWLRVVFFTPKVRAFNTWFPYAFGNNALDKRKKYTRWLVLQKARRHPYGLRLFVGKMVSGSISPPSPGYFSPFPHGTSALLITKSI